MGYDAKKAATMVSRVKQSWEETEGKTEGVDYCECELCGFRSRFLTSHYSRIHGIKKFAESESYQKERSERFSGSKNPGYQHAGKFSPFSKKFVAGYDEAIWDRREETKIQNNSDPTKLSYWTERHGEEEGKRLYVERQTTFSLEKCIEKHGLEDGTAIWEERQRKWQETLASKPADEIERINRSKAFNPRDARYSNIKSPGVFYIIEMKVGEKSYIKFGVTKRRRRFHRWRQDLVLRPILFLEGTCHDIFDFECKVKKNPKILDILTKDSGFEGYTESVDVENESVLVEQVKAIHNFKELDIDEYFRHGNKKVHRG